MKVCPFCNTQQDDGMNYCTNCGNSFTVPSLSQQSQFQPQSPRQAQFQNQQPQSQYQSQLPTPQTQQRSEQIRSTRKEKNTDKTISIVLNVVLIALLFLQLTVAPLSFSDEDDYKYEYKSLEKEHLQLETKHQQLQSDYAQLQNNYSILTNKYEEQNNTLASLQTQYENLSNLLDQKNVSYEELKAEYELITSNFSSAVSALGKSEREYENLTLDYETLTKDFSELAENRSEIYSMYNGSMENYTELEDDYDELSDSYFNLYFNVTDFFDEMRMRSPETFEQSNFITPDDPAVQDLLETILGDDADGDLTWSDREDIYDFINNNKDYSYDPYAYYPYLWFDDSVFYFNSPEFWSYPNETIKRYNKSGVFAGDCEDFTNLLISLFFAEESNNYTFGIGLDTDPYADGGGHATCFIRITGSDIYIYDIAGEYMDGNKGSAEDTLEDYGYNWNFYGEVEIWSAYNPHCSKDFEDNDEFHEWWEV